MSKDKKKEQLNSFKVNTSKGKMTSQEAIPIKEDSFSLKASDRGPTLIQDFHLLEKLRHFNRERIPERVVHARGTGAHGYFRLENCMSKYTKANFLNGQGKETPLFIRFSTVQGFRGSPDTVRDARGMAIKFYTEEGNYDIAGLSFPVFFIQDAIKFPDFIHALKPEPNTEIPQGQSAHDSFWDFVSSNEESTHALMWLMSDRGIPRSYRMMEGFGVHTFRWINKDDDIFFVKYHFVPKLGTHSLVWDEAQKIAGKDPDYHRKDLYEAIEKKDFPEWDVFVQILPEEDEFIFDFDILDPTKLWPEEIVKKVKVGSILLNKNVDNFFAETEQVAFSPGNLVPGIALSNDPLLQARSFAYPDTQVYRLGGPNFQNIPINMPLNPRINHQQDGFHTSEIKVNNVNYKLNLRNDNMPETDLNNGYDFPKENIAGKMTRGRVKRFLDYFSQAKLYFDSLSKLEQEHLIDAIKFELSKVKSPDVRKEVISTLNEVSSDISKELSDYFNIEIKDKKLINNDLGDSSDDFSYEEKSVKTSNLSMISTEYKTNTFKIAVLIDSLDLSFDKTSLDSLEKLESDGFYLTFIANEIGDLKNLENKKAEGSYHSEDSVLYDGIYVISTENIRKDYQNKLDNFIKDSFNHKKPIVYGERVNMKPEYIGKPGVERPNEDICKVFSHRRYWDR